MTVWNNLNTSLVQDSRWLPQIVVFMVSVLAIQRFVRYVKMIILCTKRNLL